MNEEQAREIAIQILGEFEGLLAAKDIVIPSPDRRSARGCVDACLRPALGDVRPSGLSPPKKNRGFKMMGMTAGVR